MNLLAPTEKQMSWPVLAILMSIFFAAMLSPVFGAPAYVMFIPAIPMCLFGAILSTALLIRSRASRYWPSVGCKIVGSSVERKLTLAGAGQRVSDAYYWVPHIEFEFTVDGKQYAAVDLGIGMIWSNDKQVADSYVERFPVGAEPLAYYNPANPSEACLTRNRTRGALIALAITTALSVAFTTAVIVLWKLQ